MAPSSEVIGDVLYGDALYGDSTLVEVVADETCDIDGIVNAIVAFSLTIIDDTSFSLESVDDLSYSLEVL